MQTDELARSLGHPKTAPGGPLERHEAQRNAVCRPPARASVPRTWGRAAIQKHDRLVFKLSPAGKWGPGPLPESRWAGRQRIRRGDDPQPSQQGLRASLAGRFTPLPAVQRPRREAGCAEAQATPGAVGSVLGAQQSTRNKARGTLRQLSPAHEVPEP